MHLHLSYDQDEAAGRVEFLRDRLYVIRTLVPPGYEAYFRERARYINAQTSASIEGNPTGEQRALFVLVEGADADAPAEVEITNLEEAYQLMQQLAADKSMRIDHGLIRTMNSIMLKDLPTRESENRGRYRTGPSLIVDSQSREVRYRPPPPEWVPELMDGLISDIQTWMDSDEHSPPVIAALAHFGLVSIHPFEDGNGRTARLLADMILQQTNWSGDGMVAVSQVIWDRRDDYYDALRETQGENFKQEVDATPFVEFHTLSLGIAAGHLEDRVVNFNRRKDAWIDSIGAAWNSRQTLGLMFMLDVSPLSTSKYARLTGASQSSAYADLTEMVEMGLLERTGRGRNTRYKASERSLADADEEDDREGEG